MEQIYHKKSELHILIDIFNVKNIILSDILTNSIFISYIINSLNLDIIHDISHPRNNHTRAVILEQGHININTRPRQQCIYIDIFLENIYFNIEKIINTIKTIYLTDTIEYHIVSR
jgi:hypothetical protein